MKQYITPDAEITKFSLDTILCVSADLDDYKSNAYENDDVEIEGMI